MFTYQDIIPQLHAVSNSMTDHAQVSQEKGVELLGGDIAIDPSYLVEVAYKRVTKFQQSVELACVYALTRILKFNYKYSGICYVF